jgi:hypothetical protein
MHRTTLKTNRFQRTCLYRIVLMGMIAVVLGLPAAPAFGQGKGKGGGGGSGGGEPPAPADPAIVFNMGGEIAVMNADGSSLTALQGLISSVPKWSPDLDGDAATAYQGTISLAGAAIVLADIRVVGGVPQALRVREIADFRVSGSAWSPDLDPATPGYQGYLSFFTAELSPPGIWGVWIEWDGNAADPSTTHPWTFDLLLPAPAATLMHSPASLAGTMLHSWGPCGERLVFSA